MCVWLDSWNNLVYGQGLLCMHPDHCLVTTILSGSHLILFTLFSLVLSMLLLSAVLQSISNSSGLLSFSYDIFRSHIVDWGRVQDRMGPLQSVHCSRSTAVGPPGGVRSPCLNAYLSTFGRVRRVAVGIDQSWTSLLTVSMTQ